MKRPISRRLLDIAIEKHEDSEEGSVRLRRTMAAAIVAQLLPDGVVVKGGSALQFRFGDAMTRFTRDLDITRSVDIEEIVSGLESALKHGWEGFTGKVVREDPADVPSLAPEYIMQPFSVKLSYNNKAWTTVALEIGYNELGFAWTYDIVDVPAELQRAFDEFGFPKLHPVKVLAPESQIAQKIHAVSAPNSKRAHDLIDIQLMIRECSIDYSKLKNACEHIFKYRKVHEWPPTVVENDRWTELYALQKRDLPVLETVSEAVAWANRLITKIASTPSL